MSPWAKVGTGLFFFLLGLGYLCQPTLVERVVSFLRDVVLNDAHIALERRKWGVFFLLISVLFLYMGYTALYRLP
ncbi:MAG TPA: hypothetical protein DCM05_06785 [Elusimicrobia bacterium]|nr:hypothetical protein [Elusimicrobiota bacterium]